ncbi:MAG: hypothetical protein ABIJ82_01565 [Patescibacteria group bacterium]|nr:hypothetical protein [Patescibacteria group bacterium]MBU1952823.1 hypothetical protein [Patescibacteria group bacterium]
MGPKATGGWGSISGFRIRTSSLAKESWSLKALSQNPGTKERPTYVHADSITIKGTVVTLVVGRRTFTGYEFDNVAIKHGVENHEKPISYYYFDAKDKSTGKYLRIWVTKGEIHNALLR